MNKSLIVIALVAGCGASNQPEGNAAAPVTQVGQRGGPSAPAQTAPSPGGQTRLTGLYEGGSAKQPNQLCIVERAGGEARFGLIVWGGSLQSCSGSGTATRQGTSLKLAMAGDSACALEARIEGGVVTLPAGAPEGCSYYCGPRARLDGARFSQSGTTAQDALKAKDLVGEPLCAGLERGR
jgi:hypothetical protein